MSEREHNEREEVFSKAVRAGKRTYFFDVKATKNNDYYLTITESKKVFGDNGDHHYQKHKLFLYREDFEKFSEGFKEAIDKITELKPEPPPPRVYRPREGNGNQPAENSDAGDSGNNGGTDGGNSSSFTDVDFDDLGKDS